MMEQKLLITLKRSNQDSRRPNLSYKPSQQTRIAVGLADVKVMNIFFTVSISNLPVVERWRLWCQQFQSAKKMRKERVGKGKTNMRNLRGCSINTLIMSPRPREYSLRPPGNQWFALVGLNLSEAVLGQILSTRLLWLTRLFGKRQSIIVAGTSFHPADSALLRLVAGCQKAIARCG